MLLLNLCITEKWCAFGFFAQFARQFKYILLKNVTFELMYIALPKPHHCVATDMY